MSRDISNLASHTTACQAPFISAILSFLLPFFHSKIKRSLARALINLITQQDVANVRPRLFLRPEYTDILENHMDTEPNQFPTNIQITKTAAGYDLHVNGRLEITGASFNVVDGVADMLRFGVDYATELGEVAQSILDSQIPTTRAAC
ncbi:hypothetical protein HAP94_13965 [Acidithiobacillus ferrivorans]|nr:hypothetical protein [Acidithiobacillus ferrivorans]